MSAPPPGFNEQASHLPDPGAAAAPIHVMRGGGNMEGSTDKPHETKQVGGVQPTNDDETILNEYGLTNPSITQHIKDFDDSFKETFLQQLRSGNCTQKGNSITKKECWAVTAVIRALIQEQIHSAIPISLPKMGTESPADHSDEIRGLANASEPAEEAIMAPCERPEETAVSLRSHDDELGGEEEIVRVPKAGSTDATEEEVNEAELPGASGTDSADSGRMSATNVVNPANVRVNVPAAAPAAASIPLGSGPVVTNNSYYEENPANFRKGQYGINLNTDESKRFYANAIVGTQRMRIRGRNAANIKARYNTKKQRLKNALANVRRRAAEEKIAANKVRERLARDREAAKRAAEKANRNALTARTDKAIANTLAKRKEKELRNAAKKIAEEERRRILATGDKTPSFMNRLRSVKNPFKRGGSRKTRRSTRRNHRR